MDIPAVVIFIGQYSLIIKKTKESYWLLLDKKHWLLSLPILIEMVLGKQLSCLRFSFIEFSKDLLKRKM